MRIVFVHRKNTDNVGDLSSCPASYLEFPKHEVVDPFDFLGHSDLTIIGGGGLMGEFFDPQMQTIVDSSDKVVLWGVGCHYSDGFRLAKWADKADMIGIRDETCGYDVVPCASCLSPKLDNVKEADKERIYYYHNHRNWRPKGNPIMGNHDSNLDDTLDFLASGKEVVTNSYHGVYWSKLMKRKSILVENWNTKFNHIANLDLHMARTHNLVFYKKVLKRFNLF